MAGRTEDKVDEEGNTLFHGAATSLTKGIAGLESISNLGIDINQPNHRGRTPLHVLCSIDWHEDLALPSSLKGQLAYFIQRTSDVNVADNDGATPLHIAATASEFLAKELLVFGADASAETAEGLTPLHLAARARQSNVVGMLTALLSRKCGHESPRAHVDAKDHFGHSPLFHACRSGRPESVSLLLAAGADPTQQDGDGMTLFDACAEFEEEQALWAGFRRPTAEDINELARRSRPTTFEAAAGIKLRDTLRPFVAEGVSLNESQHLGNLPTDSIRNDQDTTRLDEILMMLADAIVERGQSIDWISNALTRSIERCDPRAYAYTVQCFKRLERRIAVERKVATPVVDIEDLPAVDIAHVNTETLERLLFQRQYHVLEHLLQRQAIKSDEVEQLLGLFAKHGFARLLSKVPAQAAETSDVRLSSKLMVLACERTLPNLDVMRVLVEKFSVGVDAINQGLYQLSQGSHWWQPEHGIPYLISLGLCPTLQAPLQNALQSGSMFAMEAVLALMNGGADVRHVSNDGNRVTALELALRTTNPNFELVQYILSAGVPITAVAVFAAIDKKAVEVLELFLRSGADPNLRLEGVGNEGTTDGWASPKDSPSAPQFHIRQGRREWYALHRAAAPFSVDSEEERTRCARMMSALKNSGADMFAIYRQPLRRPWEEFAIFPGCANRNSMTVNGETVEEEDDDYDEWSEFDGEDEYTDLVTDDDIPKPTRIYGLQSVFHGLLESGYFVEALLARAPEKVVDFEHHNPQGRTLLLSACRSALGADACIDSFLTDVTADLHNGGYLRDPFTSPKSDIATTAVSFLLSLGADPLAVDIYGKNAMHHLLEAHDPVNNDSRAPFIQKSIRQFATEHPKLLNAPDYQGTYPLHSALQRHRRYTLLGQIRECHTQDIITTLLANGADPDVRDTRGNTALHYLADGLAEVLRGDEQRRLFQMFLGKGLDVNAQNDSGKTPLAIMLLDDGERAEQRDGSFGFAVKPDERRTEQQIDAELFAMFEQAAAKWDMRDKEGQTLLHVLAQCNTKRMAWRWRFMIEKGLDPLATDGNGSTALAIAKATGSLSRIQ